MLEYIESNVPLLLTAAIAALSVLYIRMDRQVARMRRELDCFENAAHYRFIQLEKKVRPAISDEPENKSASCSGCIGGDRLDELPE
jgi:hypothetical protein